MSLSVDPRIGSELFGYRLEALLGRGGMGVVYKAYDPRLKRYVALKLIAPELSEDERFRERFLAETELAASLEHPNVVPIHDAGEVDGQLYIAMRYVEGGELKPLLEKEGPFEPGPRCGDLRTDRRSARRRPRSRSRPPRRQALERAPRRGRARLPGRLRPQQASRRPGRTRRRKASPSARPPTPPPSRSRAATSTAAPTCTRSAASSTSA